MANTGLSTFMHAKRDEKTGEYAAPGKMAGAIEFKETLDRNDAKLYADNKRTKDTSVTGGKLALTVDDDDETVFSDSGCYAGRDESWRKDISEDGITY